MRLGSTGELRY